MKSRFGSSDEIDEAFDVHVTVRAEHAEPKPGRKDNPGFAPFW